MIERKFVTAGRAIFTLSVPADFRAIHPKCRDRYTFRVVRKPATEKWPEAFFINLLSGPENTNDYTPLGRLNPETGAVWLVSISKLTAHSWSVRLVRRVLACIWHVSNAKPEDIEAAGFEIRHAGRCGRCGRVLTVPESIDCGLGPKCAAMMGDHNGNLC